MDDLQHRRSLIARSCLTRKNGDRPKVAEGLTRGEIHHSVRQNTDLHSGAVHAERNSGSASAVGRVAFGVSRADIRRDLFCRGDDWQRCRHLLADASSSRGRAGWKVGRQEDFAGTVVHSCRHRLLLRLNKPNLGQSGDRL